MKADLVDSIKAFAVLWLVIGWWLLCCLPVGAAVTAVGAEAEAAAGLALVGGAAVAVAIPWLVARR